MEDFNNTSMPLFKKIDATVFDRIDKFKAGPGYNGIQDYYNGLDEEQQKVFKGISIVIIFFIPFLILATLWWQNQSLKSDMEARLELISKANQILSQRQGLVEVSPTVLSSNPIDSASMMTSRLSNLLSTIGVDLSKFQVSNFVADQSIGTILKSEADFQFNNLSTDELMNVFMTIIQREKFRIQSVNITRNPDSNLLKGQFHAVHFGNSQSLDEEE